MTAGTLLETITASIIAGVGDIVHSAINYLPKLILAILIIFIGRKFARYAVKYSEPVIAKTLTRVELTNLALKSIYYVIFFIAFLVALDQLEITLTPLLASAGIAGIIVGVAVAPVLSGYLSGIFLLIDRPFEIGDRVEMLGMNPPLVGYVKDIGFRVTKILTVDGNMVVVPNTSIAGRDIINYSSEDKRTRKELPIGISYESDLEKAIEIIIKAAKETAGVITGGAISMAGVEYKLEPQVLVVGFGHSSLDLVLRVWFEDPDHLEVRVSNIYKTIFQEFDKNGIEIPYPHTDVVVKSYISKELKDAIGGSK